MIADNVYAELQLEQILKTIATLEHRISERFPGSGLSRVAVQLHHIGKGTGEVLLRARRPNWLVRGVAGAAIILVIALVIALGVYVASHSGQLRPSDAPALSFWGTFLSAAESAVQNVVFLALALWFLFTLEMRLKRRVALRELHRIRSIVHIVDMHQLTKDPERLLEGPRTPSSPDRGLTRFELSRYLDYCTELLSLSSKLAALHVQHLNDPVVLEAVSDIEVLAANLSNKIWQKIVVLDNTARLAEPG
ncbi:MAG: hypothetical protein FIB01_03490 [Gemmatimonadetes bacterium]|nr:hypothetical protein [Gemmatimonadota bacterium]